MPLFCRVNSPRLSLPERENSGITTTMTSPMITCRGTPTFT